MVSFAEARNGGIELDETLPMRTPLKWHRCWLWGGSCCRDELVVVVVGLSLREMKILIFWVCDFFKYLSGDQSVLQLLDYQHNLSIKM